MIDAVRRTSAEEWRIIDSLYPSLHRFAAVAAPWDVDADDLLHDALVDVLGKRLLSDLDHPAAYLRKVMINLAAGHSRRGASRLRALQRLAATDRSRADPQYPSDMADLERLSPKDRAVLYLAEVEGYRYDEISGMLGCTATAARQRASRARRRLRIEIAAEGRG